VEEILFTREEKMKKNKLLLLIFGVLMYVLYLTPIGATASTCYFRTSDGTELTSTQYYNLSRAFDDDTIYHMSSELIDSLKDNSHLKTVSVDKYFQTDEYLDSDGTVLSVRNREIDEKTAKKSTFMNNVIQSYDRTYSTSTKKVRMTITLADASIKVVTLKNTWLTLPRTHSYDILAVRPDNFVFKNNYDPSTFSAWQNYDGKTISYNRDSNHINQRSGFGQGNGGVGISINIPNNVTSSLSSTMIVRFSCGTDPFKIYGTYQHATSSISLSDSKSYNFSSSGLGNVVDFSSQSKRSKYDGMDGVFLSYRSGEEYD
jgi:hypothetical protein